ncbi:MAG: DUF4350 domain-containing protein [Haloarculaceae archaeon]
MDAEDRLARAGIFVGVAVVVALVVGFGATLGSSGPSDTSVAYPNASDMVPEVVEATDGTAEAGPVGEESRVVLVDNSHANRFDPDDLRPLLEELGADHEVVFTSGGDDLEAALSEADAYLIVDPGVPHSETEADAVESFVADGGRVVMLGEPTRVDVATGPLGGSLVDVRSRLGRLGSRFGVAFGTDYLYDEVTNEGNYKRVLAEGRGDLEGNRTALYTATTVEAPGGERLLVTPETTRLAARSEARRHPVAVRSGNVVAVGDSTFLTGGKSVVADNERLVRTIAAFAVGGDRTRGVADYPHYLPDEPRISYTSGELLNATKALAREVRATGRSPTVSATTRSLAPRRTDVLVTTFDDLERMDATATGLAVTSTTVSVPGYEGSRDGVAVVHRPAGPIDLVVAAASPERATAVVGTMNGGEFHGEVLSDRTAVTVVPETEEAEEGTNGPGTDTGEPPAGDPAPPPTGEAVGP